MDITEQRSMLRRALRLADEAKATAALAWIKSHNGIGSMGEAEIAHAHALLDGTAQPNSGSALLKPDGSLDHQKIYGKWNS